jgi:hypothetical protein
MTSKEIEEIPTKLAPLVTPHPSTSAHNIIYIKGGKIQAGGLDQTQLKQTHQTKNTKKKLRKS